jgi:ATP-dependent helicase/nuclease subunit A
MSKVLADQPARDRIVTELGRSLLVEAGAGSGKTHELAARMAAGVANGVYRVEHMAAVTFTRKAAAELRGRFQIALEDALANCRGAAGGSADGARADRLRGALANLERFFAGTIHAFCARLLRERPIEAGVSPGFTELDEVEERLLRRQSWRDYRSQERAAGNADLARLAEAGIHAKDLDDAFDVVCLYEDVDFAADETPAPDGGAAWKALERFWAAVQSDLPDPLPAETTCRTQQAAARFGRDWRFAMKARPTAARLAELLDCWTFTPKVTQYPWATDKKTAKAIADRIKALHETFRADVVRPYLTTWRQSLYAPCVRVLMRARDHAALERRRRNTLSFNDLLLRAARVLCENAAVCDALRRKYRHIFVDEFQDTDPIQAQIMLRLHGDDTPDAGPRRTLFVVGDPKQSIYRFRRADISIYNEVRARLAGADGAGLVTLTTNFRSVPALCEWANRVFQETFPAEPDEWQPRFAPLVPRRDAAARPAIWTLTVAATADDVIGDEAARIARYIRREVEAGRRRYRDFLVLTRKKKRLQPYARALEAARIPIEVSGAGAFGESEEVRDLSDLLLALADPQDGVALVGVLRGRLFGLSDPQLFAYRQAGGYFGLFSELPAPDAAARPVASALETLRRWYKWTRMLPAGAALERVLEDSGYLALAASSVGGVEAGDLLHAVDRVRAAVEVGFTLAEAAEALIDADEESSEVESLPLEPGRQDVVRLMNLHKAKGLEAPVVFLADPTGGFEPQVDVRVVRDGAVARGCFPVRVKFASGGKKVIAEPPDWPRHERDEERYLEAEASRLLYVASTRAKDALVVGRSARTGGSGARRAWAALDPYLAGAAELAVPDAVTLPVMAKVDLSAAAARRAADAAEAKHEQGRHPSWAVTSVTSEIKRLPRLAPDADAEEAEDVARRRGELVDWAESDPTRAITVETPSRRADAGLAWGTLVHGLLEHAMRHKGATRDDLRRLALWLTVDEPDLRSVIDDALDTVEAVAPAGFWQMARASAECHEEVPFAVREAGGDVPTVVNGTIDLIYNAAGEWRLVDYKTDRQGGEDHAALEARYASQLRAYEDAWRQVTGGSVQSEIVPARKT